MCCVGYKVGSNRDWTHELASIQQSVTCHQLIFLKTEENEVVFLYHLLMEAVKIRKTAENYQDGMQQEETEGQKTEKEKLSALIQIVYLQSQNRSPSASVPRHHQPVGHVNLGDPEHTHFNRIKPLFSNCFLQTFLFLSVLSIFITRLEITELSCFSSSLSAPKPSYSAQDYHTTLLPFP